MISGGVAYVGLVLKSGHDIELAVMDMFVLGSQENWYLGPSEDILLREVNISFLRIRRNVC